MILAIHAGAGPGSPADDPDNEERHAALLTALGRGREVLEHGGDAVEAVTAAVIYLEDGAPLFNAGRGSVLCADGSVEMSASLMRGRDRAAGAVAAARRTRQPILAARKIMETSPHVFLAGEAADRFAAAGGLEQCEPDYFVTDRQRDRLDEIGSDFARGTVGAVCLDGDGQLAAATSTGGRRGQAPGRIGDTPVIGAGTWADERIAVSCTGDGEQFIRAAAAHQLATRARTGGESLDQVSARVLQDVGDLNGFGGLIAIDAAGNVAMPFTTAAMNRGLWRGGDEPVTWI